MQLNEDCRTKEDQKHQADIQTIVARDGRIFSGSDDGVVKVWSLDNLKLLHEFKGHDYAINHLMLFKDRLYSASMDQTLKVWQLDTWKLIATISGHDDSPRRLATDGEFIFSGDDKGEVIKWTKDGKELVRYGMVEEVWDLHIQRSHIYTIRDRGLTIGEMKGNSSNIPIVRSEEGRAPVYICGEHLAMLNRSGTVIGHYENKCPDIKKIGELKGHENMITGLSGWGEYLVSSGYDEKVFLWNLSSGQLESRFSVQGTPNSICAIDRVVIVGCQDGSILKLKAA